MRKKGKKPKKVSVSARRIGKVRSAKKATKKGVAVPYFSAFTRVWGSRV